MGECVYCGEEAGFLRKEHKVCRSDNVGQRSVLAMAVLQYIREGGRPFEDLEMELLDLANAGRLRPGQLQETAAEGWRYGAMHLVEEDRDPPSDEEEARLDQVAARFNLSANDESIWKSKLAMHRSLRDLMHGRAPKPNEPLPFNLQAGEQPVWLFHGVVCEEDRTHRSYVGATHGVSIRVARGVYYRTGSFKGRPVETVTTDPVGIGDLGLTSQHLYFSDGSTALKIPYKKVVAFHPFDIGVEVEQEGKPRRIFSIGPDGGWYVYNAVMNVQHHTSAST